MILRCHFTAHDGTKCYMGSLGYEGDLVAGLFAIDLHFKRCKNYFNR